MTPLPSSLVQRRPLLSVETAAYLREESQDATRLQVDIGKLCAWDLRTKNSHTRGCLRILARSLNETVSESDIYFWVPNYNPTAAQITRLLNVSQWLVAALIQDGSLVQIGKPAKTKESPKVCRQSLLKFLQNRRVGFAPTIRSGENALSSRLQRENAPCTKNSYGLHTVGISPLKLRKLKK